MNFSLITFVSIFISLINAQLTGSVGPLTHFSAKASKKICNVLDYGAVANNSTDLGPPLLAAWNGCKTGGLVYIPPGNYAMATWVTLSGGSASAIQLDGIIYRHADTGGHMIIVTNSNDFEFFSGTSKGAMQGYGYRLIPQGIHGPRFLRFVSVTNYSLHGIAFIDPAYYFMVIETCTNGEIYNLILRGISVGETDGIDLSGSNNWVHDVEVTNGDECVTVKSPAKNILIESIHCNLSGGTAIGSLGLGTAISNVYYRRLYMNQADACYIKTNGGTGTVTDITWDTVIVHGGAYILAVNEHWGTSNGGTGVQISNLYYKDWHGYNLQNSRPTIRLECDDNVPCYNITLDNVNLWTSSGNYVTWACESAFGVGGCLHDTSKHSSYAYSATTVSSKPPYATATMPNDLASPFPSTVPFTIPPVPTTFYPGATPSSALLKLSSAGGL